MGDEPFKSDLITLNSVSDVFKISLLKQVWHLTKNELDLELPFILNRVPLQILLPNYKYWTVLLACFILQKGKLLYLMWLKSLSHNFIAITMENECSLLLIIFSRWYTEQEHGLELLSWQTVSKHWNLKGTKYSFCCCCFKKQGTKAFVKISTQS